MNMNFNSRMISSIKRAHESSKVVHGGNAPHKAVVGQKIAVEVSEYDPEEISPMSAISGIEYANVFRVACDAAGVDPECECILNTTEAAIKSELKLKYELETIRKSGERKFKNHAQKTATIEAIFGVNVNVADLEPEIFSDSKRYETVHLDDSLMHTALSYGDSKQAISRFADKTGRTPADIQMLWSEIHSNLMQKIQQCDNHFELLVKMYLHYFACIEAGEMSRANGVPVRLAEMNNVNAGHFTAYNQNWDNLLQNVERNLYTAAIGMSPEEAKFLWFTSWHYPGLQYSVTVDGEEYVAASSKITIPSDYPRAECVIPDQALNAVCANAQVGLVANSPAAIEKVILKYASNFRLLDILPAAKEFASNLTRLGWADSLGANLQLYMPRSKHYRDIIPWCTEHTVTSAFATGFTTHRACELIVGGAVMANMVLGTVKDLKAASGIVPGQGSDLLANPRKYAQYQTVNYQGLMYNTMLARQVNASRSMIVQHVYKKYNIHLASLNAFELTMAMLQDDCDLIRMVDNAQPTAFWCCMKNTFESSTTSCVTATKSPPLEIQLHDDKLAKGYLLVSMFGLNPNFDLNIQTLSTLGYDMASFMQDHPQYQFDSGLFWDADLAVYYLGNNYSKRVVQPSGFTQTKPTRGRGAGKKIDPKGKGLAEPKPPTPQGLATLVEQKWGDMPDEAGPSEPAPRRQRGVVAQSQAIMSAPKQQYEKVKKSKKEEMDITRMYTLSELDDMIEKDTVPLFNIRPMTTRVGADVASHMKHTLQRLVLTAMNNMRLKTGERENFPALLTTLKAIPVTASTMKLLGSLGNQMYPYYSIYENEIKVFYEQITGAGIQAGWVNFRHEADGTISIVLMAKLSDDKWTDASGEELCPKFDYFGWF